MIVEIFQGGVYMKTFIQRTLALLLAMICISGAMSMPASAATGDDGTTNWDFIIPVTHQTTVPSGYVGIYNVQQLNAIQDNPSGNYILMNSIDLGSVSNWKPIGGYAFSGVFDGNGYVISNMKITSLYAMSVYYYAGFFQEVSGRIKNLGIASSTINISSSGLTGYACIGMIAGRCSGVIENCFNKGSINCSVGEYLKQSTAHIGGIVGDGGTVRNCYNVGAISTTLGLTCHVGGIAGSGEAENSFNTGNITVRGESKYDELFTVSAGGILGYSHGLKDSYNTGKVDANSNKSAYAGGVAGQSSIISNSYNMAPIIVTGSESVYGGGLAGSARQLSNSYNIGAVTATTSKNGYVGGLVGELNDQFSFGASIQLTTCFNTGNVTGSAGSFAYIGGIAGTSSGSIIQTYNAGQLAATAQTTFPYIGGVLGKGSVSTVSDSFFLNQIANVVGNDATASTNTKALSKSDMQNAVNYSNFDFTNTWTIEATKNSGFPYLKNLPLAEKSNENDGDGGDSNNNENSTTKKKIFGTKYDSNFWNWLLFIVCFGFIWMWF